jgi:hypothetical protein
MNDNGWMVGCRRVGVDASLAVEDGA